MKLIPLTQGLFAQVDDEDYDYLNQFKWCALKSRNTFYAVRCKFIGTVNGKQKNLNFSMHRDVSHLIKGDNKQIDHKDRNGLNNQKSNLRVATPSENRANARAKGGSKFMGVKINKRTSSIKTTTYYIATITKNGVVKHIGCFKDELMAAKAYNNEAIKIHGEFANLNKI